MQSDSENESVNAPPGGGGTPCPARCMACGRAYVIVYVHGHGQCAGCGVNTEPCCQPDAWPDNSADADDAAAE